MPLQADNTAMNNPRSLLFAVLLLISMPAWTGTQQNHAEIREAIAAFLHAQTLNLPGQVSIKIDEVDRRTVLPACPALDVFLPPGGKLLGNSTVGVRCLKEMQPSASQGSREINSPGKNGWVLFVPAHVKVSASLLITNRPLRQGQMLGAGDLASQNGELTQLGMLTDPLQAIGKILKSSVSAGQVLKQDMLRAPYAVTQGQAVQMQVAGAGFSIRSEGQALNNAEAGQIVQIRTLSGQVVSGTAQPDGTVAVRP